MGVAIAALRHHNDWNRHPLAQVLAKYGHDWRTIASGINAEFRDIEKFALSKLLSIIWG